MGSLLDSISCKIQKHVSINGFIISCKIQKHVSINGFIISCKIQKHVSINGFITRQVFVTIEIKVPDVLVHTKALLDTVDS